MFFHDATCKIPTFFEGRNFLNPRSHLKTKRENKNTANKYRYFLEQN